MLPRHMPRVTDCIRSLPRPGLKALHLMPGNLAISSDYNHPFRVEDVVQGRGAQVSFSVGPQQSVALPVASWSVALAV